MVALKIAKAVYALIVIWLCVCGFFFILGLFTSFVWWPHCLPLPWSHVQSVVETGEGNIFLDVGFYGRILRYARDGKFVATYPYPENVKNISMLVDQKGHLGVAGFNFYRFEENGAWTLWAKRKKPGESYWKFNSKGTPILTNIVPDRSSGVDQGDGATRGSRGFLCADGSMLIPMGVTGSTIVRIKDGKIVDRYVTAWFSRPFTFPWPMGLAWPIVFFLVYINKKWKKDARIADSAYNREKLVFNTIFEFILFIIFAIALVVVPVIIVKVANSLSKENMWHIWLVPLVVIPWWVLISYIGLRVWAALHKRSGDNSADTKNLQTDL